MALSPHALTTVAAVRQQLVGRETIPPEHEPLLEDLINATSEAVERYCGVHFERRSWTERLDGHSGPKLYLRHYPIRAVTSVTVDGTPVTDYVLVPSTLYPGAYEPVLVRDAGWQTAAQYGIEVVYEAGFVLPGQPGRDLPYDLQQAATELVAAAYLRRDKSGVRSESFEGFSAQFEAWPLHVRQVLDRYRRY